MSKINPAQVDASRNVKMPPLPEREVSGAAKSPRTPSSDLEIGSGLPVVRPKESGGAAQVAVSDDVEKTSIIHKHL